MSNVALYIRLSREDGDKSESDSIINQRKVLDQFIENKSEFIFVDYYIDDGYTGTSFNRPAFKRMMVDIENNVVDCVIVKDLSRFGRDYIDVGQYLQKTFPQKNVRFISVGENIDSAKNKYDLMLPIKNIFNEQYARDISEKVIGSIRAKQKNGEFIGAFATYGYLKDPNNKNKLIIDEYASIIVNDIFNMFLNGKSKLYIANYLNENNVLCPSEYKKSQGLNYTNNHLLANTNYWTHSTIHRILKNEIYIGNMVQHKNNRSRYNHNKKALPEEKWIVISNTHSPIIDNDTWTQTQELLSRNSRTIDFTQNVSIFAGYLVCGDCGRAMSKVKRHKQVEYICGTYKRYTSKYCTQHRILHSVLENILINELNVIIRKIKLLEEKINQYQVTDQNITSNNNVQKEVAKCDIELDRIYKFKKSIYEDFRSDIITKDEYLAYKEDYNTQEGILLNKKQILLEKSNNNEFSLIENPLLKRLKEIGKIEELDRNLIGMYIDKIVIFENQKIKIIHSVRQELDQLETYLSD